MCKVKGCEGWWWKGETIDVESSLRVARLASTVCWPGCVLQAQCPVTRNPRRTQSRCNRVRLRMYLKCVHRRISVSCISRAFSPKDAASLVSWTFFRLPDTLNFSLITLNFRILWSLYLWSHRMKSPNFELDPWKSKIFETKNLNKICLNFWISRILRFAFYDDFLELHLDFKL